MIRVSLRSRFALLAAALVLVVAAIVAVVAYVAMRDALLGRAAREARTQAEQLAAMVDTRQRLPTAPNENLVDIRDRALTQQLRAPGYVVEVAGPRGALIQASPPSRDGPVRLPAGFSGGCVSAGGSVATLSAPDVSLACRRIGSRSHPIGSVTVGVPLAASLGSLATLRTVLIAGVLSGALLAGVLALLLAGRAMRPIGWIARTAEAIRSGERPFRRIGYRGRDELGALAAVLDASFAELEEALERQRRFGADASHELRTPLAAIRANVELLRGWAADEPAARERALVALDQASRRASRLVEDLLYLATIEREPNRAHAPVRLDELVVGVVREASGLRDDVAIRLSDLDEVTVRGDSLALQQVAVNLIDNALRVSPPGATVTVGLVARGGEATVSVTDQGPGIQPERLERIFERFYTDGNGGARGKAGLGLAIARAITEDHGGRLTARNATGGGATFTLTLPAPAGSSEAGQAARDRRPTPEAAATSCSNKA